jgi:hypothetical protein
MAVNTTRVLIHFESLIMCLKSFEVSKGTVSCNAMCFLDVRMSKAGVRRQIRLVFQNVCATSGLK